MVTAQRRTQSKSATRLEDDSNPPTTSQLTKSARPKPLPDENSKIQNVGPDERVVSIASGLLLAAAGLSRRSLSGLLIAGLGGALTHRGLTGHCQVYKKLGMNTHNRESGFKVEQVFLVDKPAEELYQFWRNFENLPRIMEHIESVQLIGDRHSHWVSRISRVAGGRLEWDAEITQDDPNRLIAWRSLHGSDVEHSGVIRFAKGIGTRGTEVRVNIDYLPPAGHLGEWVATLMGESPKRQVREDLRNFKRYMETGEIATVIGQPRGTCDGNGKRETR